MTMNSSNNRVTLILIFALLWLSVSSCTSEPAASQESNANILTFYGASDASAAVTLDANCFLVADDENNTLRLYPFQNDSLPLAQFDLTSHLGTTEKFSEADIEGATRVGSRIYWITSHGRNLDGKPRPNRYRFFATDHQANDGSWTITPAGSPCSTLVQAMLQTPALQPLGLDRATQLDSLNLTKKQLKKLAPKEDGLNIEALAASPDHSTLYIGFRNPLIPDPKTGRLQALVIPLQNFQQVIEQQAPPQFGSPLLWDLDRRGLRCLEYSPCHKCFFLIAGPRDDETGFDLYRWDGNPGSQPAKIPYIFNTPGFSPEAILLFDDRPDLYLLSDDGSRLIQLTSPSQCKKGDLLPGNRCQNKHLINPSQKSFRALRLSIP